MGLFFEFDDLFRDYYEQLDQLRDIANNSVNKTRNVIIKKMYHQVVVPISNVWYAPEAIEYFEKFCLFVKDSGENITELFDNLRGSLQYAIQNWAKDSGGEEFILSSIDEKELILDVSAIKSEQDGNIIIDEENAIIIIESLEKVEMDIQNDLKEIYDSIKEKIKLVLQYAQREALDICFEKLSEEVHEFFKYLLDGKNSLRVQIHQSVQKYSKLS